MKDYSMEEYLSDLTDPEIPHARSYERFVAFYERQAELPNQATQKVVGERIAFVIPRGRILELGCHSAFNCIHFAEMGFHVTGVDISAPLLEIGERRIKAAQLQEGSVRLICSDILEFKPAGKFDTVILTEVLEHVLDPAAVVVAAARTMAAGAVLYVSAPSINNGNNAHLRGVTPADLGKWRDDAGLTGDVIHKHCHGQPTTFGTFSHKKT